MSQIGLIIVAVFICCHSFKWVPNVYELKQSGKSAKEFDWPVWIREYWLHMFWNSVYLMVSECTSNLSSLLTTVSSAINVYIYFFKHKKFVLSLIFPNRVSHQLPDVVVTRSFSVINLDPKHSCSSLLKCMIHRSLI